MSILPKRGRGRQSPSRESQYHDEVSAFCRLVTQIASTLDFKVSSRGWGYILEEHGLLKTEFDAAQKLINDCRKSGDLPIDICAEDEARLTDNLEDIDEETPEEFARDRIDAIRRSYGWYTPISFWEYQPNYIEMWVEKIDLKNLFNPICVEYSLPLANTKGWNGINSRAAIMRRFAYWEARGRQCVLLFCGDHDPGGLVISGSLRSNLYDLSQAVGWNPQNLIIDRFGLNEDFINDQGLTWIDNLQTSQGAYPLDDPRHPDHTKSYVQSYLRMFGARKVEANALVVRPEAGRLLCRQAIERYIDLEGVARYEAALLEHRDAVRTEISRLIGGFEGRA